MWMYLPKSTSCRSAPAWGASTSGLDSLCRRLEPSVTLSGRPTAAKSWLRAWKTKPWMMRLSGRILPHSTAIGGMASWTGSLAACHVSRTASPENVLGQAMNATYGPRLLASLAKLNPHSCFWKTSQVQPDIFAGELGANWTEWVTGLRQDCSQRQKSARAISGSGFSCWPTARVTTDGGSPNRAALEGRSKKKNQCLLEDTVAMWPTANWHDGRRPGSDATSTQGWNLKREAEMWPTPGANDHKGTVKLGQRRGQLDNAAEQKYRFSRLDLQTSTPGVKSSKSTRRLNPRFVELLMGWPIGWSACEPVGMELWRCKLHGHLSALLRHYGDSEGWSSAKYLEVE